MTWLQEIALEQERNVGKSVVNVPARVKQTLPVVPASVTFVTSDQLRVTSERLDAMATKLDGLVTLVTALVTRLDALEGQPASVRDPVVAPLVMGDSQAKRDRAAYMRQYRQKRHVATPASQLP